MLKVMIEVRGEALDAQGIKEKLAMDLEQFGDVRVVKVRQDDNGKQMTLMTQGRWIGNELSGYADGYPVYDTVLCSECGFEWDAEVANNAFSFCPACGTDMRGAVAE